LFVHLACLGAGGGVAAGEVVQQERARGRCGRSTRASSLAKFLKVAVDGTPYLRKENLQDAGYDQLMYALQEMFCSHFTICE
jgi:hypothetical protein